MAKILTFRGKDAASSDLDFLTDENQTLSFRKSDGSGISVDGVSQSSLPGLFPDPKKDWSNQELADLYKVRQLLSGANMPVETERGVTDEGDPWFVFCHITGEVFIHLCRIDGAYLLDSPNVLRPLRGDSFSALIADFTNQALPAPGSADASEGRVIRLERGGKVRLHPSAMLAALIWTLLMASDELVLLAPEETETDNDALLSFEGLFTVEQPADTVEATALPDTDTAATSLMKDPSPDSPHFAPAAEGQGQMREAALHQQGLAAHQNGFAVGLSTIAIAMGFMSEVVLLDNQRKVLESLKELGFSDYGQDAEQTATLDITDGDKANPLLAMLADFLGLDLAFDTELAQAPVAETPTSLLQQALTQLSDSALTGEETPSLVNIATLPVSVKTVSADPVAPFSDEMIALEDDMAPAKKTTDVLLADATPEMKPLVLSEILQIWQDTQIEEFQLDQGTIKASFDIFSANIIDASFFDAATTIADTNAATVTDIDLDTPDDAFRLTNLYEFDGLAERLIEFFEAKGSELGFITQGNGFTAIDRDALKTGDVDFIEWQTVDGKSISVVGSQSDFQHFDMTG